MYEGHFFKSFEIVEDLREQGKVKHRLLDIVFIVVSAVISGCNEWKEIKWWTELEVNQKWLRKYIELSNGVPSLSTIGRLFNIIAPVQFEKCFASWMQDVVRPEDQDIVSIDGKTMRGSADGDKKGAHIVSAIQTFWTCSTSRVALSPLMQWDVRRLLRTRSLSAVQTMSCR